MAEQSHTPGPYLLMKRGLYYRPDSMGYTGIRDNAGRYSEAEANDHADAASGVVPILLAEAAEFSPNCFGDLALAHVIKQRDTLVEAARAALEQLRASEDFKLRRGHQAAALECAIAKATGGSV